MYFVEGQLTFRGNMSPSVFRNQKLATQETNLSHVASSAMKCHSVTACYLLYAGFLIGAFFYPEDGGKMFLRNVG
jgi:hypothetical protein